MDKKFEIKYHQFEEIEQLGKDEQELVRAAMRAIKNSYAPYSKFHVGAAVRLETGDIVSGANQENAAYPSGLCAERTAMFAANATHPNVPQVSIAITARYKGKILDFPPTPCGACRQVMAEYQKIGGRPMSVILYGKKVIYKFDKVDDILPMIFDSI